MNSTSNQFTVQIIPQATTASPVGSAVPPLTQLISLNQDRWTLAAGRISRNGVAMTQTQQPNQANVLYINTRDATWLKTAPYPDAIWQSGPHGYAFWNGTTFTFTGHGPDGGFF